jgi:hypothetical protein
MLPYPSSPVAGVNACHNPVMLTRLTDPALTQRMIVILFDFTVSAYSLMHSEMVTRMTPGMRPCPV